MAEKTDEQMEKERKAVASMAGATSHMKLALERIQTLESALSNAKRALAVAKDYIPDAAYCYVSQNDRGPSKQCRSICTDAMAAIDKVLN